MDERDITDEYLAVKMKTVEAQTSEAIRHIRLDGDHARATQRAGVDARTDDDRAVIVMPSSGSGDPGLVQERERSDRAQMAERVKEDRARARERFQSD